MPWAILEGLRFGPTKLQQSREKVAAAANLATLTAQRLFAMSWNWSNSSRKKRQSLELQALVQKASFLAKDWLDIQPRGSKQILDCMLQAGICTRYFDRFAKLKLMDTGGSNLGAATLDEVGNP